MKEKTEHITIYRDENSYCNLPDIVRLRNGDILTLFREAPIRPFWTHVDPWSRLVVVRSMDDGQTWDSSTRTTIAGPAVTHDMNIATMTQMSDGALTVNYCRWQIVQSKKDLKEEKYMHQVAMFRTPEQLNWFNGIAATDDGIYLTKSVDDGHMWSPSEKLQVPGPCRQMLFTGKSGVMELPDGTWLIPLSGMDWGDRTERIYLERVFVVRSRNKGKSLEEPTIVADDPEGIVFPGSAAIDSGFTEPALLRLPKGKIVAMLRTYEGHLYQVDSYDNGRTWSRPEKTQMWGYPAHMIRLRSGRILCAYGYRRPPYGVRACLSEDTGETWDIKNEKVLRADGLGVDLGYPASVQLKDDRILTVYWFHGNEPNPTVRYIAGTMYSEE